MPEAYPLQPYLDGHLFRTATGVDYFLLFRPEGALFPDLPGLAENIFSVLFFPLHASPEGLLATDERIMATVVDAIRAKMKKAAMVIGAFQKSRKSISSARLIHQSNPWKDDVVKRFFELLAEFSKE